MGLGQVEVLEGAPRRAERRPRPQRAPFLGLPIAFLCLLGCKHMDTANLDARDLPPTFRPLHTLVLDDTAVLVGGVDEAGGQYRAAIVRVDRAGARRVLDTDGTGVLSLARSGARLFGLLKRPPTPRDMGESRLLVSDDGGEGWRDLGRIPIKAGTQLAATSADEIFVLGIAELVRSADGGASWALVPVPGNDLTEARVAVVNGRLLVFGAGVDATADGGRTFHHSDMGASRVFAADAWGVVAMVGGKVRLGRMRTEGEPEWVATFKEPIVPFRLVIDEGGQRVRMLATERGAGVVQFESSDGSATWRRLVLPSLPEEGAADLGPRRWVAVDARHRLLTPR